MGRSGREQWSQVNDLEAVRLPAMSAEQTEMWRLILRLAARLRDDQWALIGGQMVALYAAGHDRAFPRVTSDVDVLANMEVLSGNLASCTRALTDMGMQIQYDSSGAAYRFTSEGQTGPLQVDLLAPDHGPAKRRLRTRGGDTIETPGGTQALRRVHVVAVSLPTGERGNVPVPNLLGAIVLKAAAWTTDTRDRDRHSQDAALLATFIDDVPAMLQQRGGSDGQRLRKLDTALRVRAAQEWLLLDPDEADAGYASWTELIAGCHR